MLVDVLMLCCHLTMKNAVLTALAVALSGCADGSGVASTSASGTTAIYSPPVRLGGRGSVIFLPYSSTSKSAKEPTALEAPDLMPHPVTPEWLQGTWLMSATPDDISRGRCNSGTTDTYNPDGTIDTFDYRGRWKLDSGKLTETIVETFSGDLKVGTSWTIKIRRLGPHEGATEGDDGWQPMLRCRPGDINR